MAVQAQYPSFVLHPHRSNDCSLQLQTQTQTLVDDHSDNKVDMNQSMSLLHQFHNQNVDVSTGLRLSFHDQHLLSVSSQSSVSSLLSQQRHEIDMFLNTQGEELRRMLASKRQAHYHTLVQAAHDTVSRQMREKEAEADKAKRRNAELEARAAHLSMEAQVWEAKARAHEVEAATLQSQLQQAIVRRESLLLLESEVTGEPEDAESAYIDPERVELVGGPGCKACGKRVASVVLLPCRHLCVCSECDGVVSACPLCLSFRSSSIEVYMS